MLAIDVDAKIDDFSLQVELPASDSTTVLIGPNGAGKTTLLKCVLGVVTPTRGVIRLGDNELLCTESGTNVATEDRKLGYVPQRYALFSHMSVRDNVGFGIQGVDRETRSAQVSELLDDLAIAHLAERATPSLSGGESQRVALARALAIGPRALMLDEPTAALDASARRKVRQFLATRLDAIGIPTVVVSHDIEDVEAFGGRVAVLEKGRLTQLGNLDALRSEPATPFVEEFLSGGR